MWFSTSRSRKIGHVEIDIELRAKWPPNHKFGTISLAGATDADGDLLTWNVAGVTQDEPTNGLGARGDAERPKVGTCNARSQVSEPRTSADETRMVVVAK